MRTFGTYFGAVVAILVAASAVNAQHQNSIKLAFSEGAPKDQFVITNTGHCVITAAIRIDLTRSAGRLIFDTTASGAGVEEYQPFEVSQGKDFVSKVLMIEDGDQLSMIKIKDLPPDTEIVITVDVDDQLSQSDLGQIRISGDEFEGATVSIFSNERRVNAVFGKDARTQLDLTPCPTS